jgi:hypothetical protein
MVHRLFQGDLRQRIVDDLNDRLRGVDAHGAGGRFDNDLDRLFRIGHLAIDALESLLNRCLHSRLGDASLGGNLADSGLEIAFHARDAPFLGATRATRCGVALRNNAAPERPMGAVKTESMKNAV